MKSTVVIALGQLPTVVSAVDGWVFRIGLGIGVAKYFSTHTVPIGSIVYNRGAGIIDKIKLAGKPGNVKGMFSGYKTVALCLPLAPSCMNSLENREFLHQNYRCGFINPKSYYLVEATLCKLPAHIPVISSWILAQG